MPFFSPRASIFRDWDSSLLRQFGRFSSFPRTPEPLPPWIVFPFMNIPPPPFTKINDKCVCLSHASTEISSRLVPLSFIGRLLLRTTSASSLPGPPPFTTVYEEGLLLRTAVDARSYQTLFSACRRFSFAFLETPPSQLTIFYLRRPVPGVYIIELKVPDICILPSEAVYGEKLGYFPYSFASHSGIPNHFLSFFFSQYFAVTR